MARVANRLPANKNVKWALGSNLWNYFPRVPFTDILDVMRDTGFIGVRVMQFPQILTTYNLTTAELEKEVSKRNLEVITISFNGPAHDTCKRREVIGNARKAMGFLKNGQRGWWCFRRRALTSAMRISRPRCRRIWRTCFWPAPGGRVRGEVQGPVDAAGLQGREAGEYEFQGQHF